MRAERPLLQYRGELLPLEDEGGVLTGAGGTGRSGERTVTVLICGERADGRTRGARVGVVVRQVLDVATGDVLTGG